MNETMRALQALLCMSAMMLLGCGGYHSREHVYELSETPQVLTEELAIAKARETMAAEGFDLERWHLQKLQPGSARLRAAFGTNDYLEASFGRTTFTWGRLHFTDGSHGRCVQIRLEGNRVICDIVTLL
jgi:hypothetical protein